jgi:LPS export ABC transporter protein LptC/lipopolysaccharide transport protein LptA
MAMTATRDMGTMTGRRTGDGLVMAVDRTREFRKARRRTVAVRVLRIAFPVIAVGLLGVYALTIAQTAGVVGGETLSEFASRKILPEDLTMKNPRYEGFTKDGGSYVFTAKTAEQDLKLPNVIKLNGITGEVYQADKTRTDITAVRGVFNNAKSILDLYEEINVVSQSGLKAKLTRATMLTKEDLLTSPEPVIVEFPNGSVRSKQMTLRQKAREATFTEDVAVELTPPADEKPKDPAAEAQKAEAQNNANGSALFTPASGPINIDANRLDLNDGSKTALFTGSVRARQGDSHLTTPELEVSYDGEGMMGATGTPAAAAPAPGAAKAPAGKVRRIVAKKPVVMKRANGDVVTSDTAEFDAQAETALLTGEVIMTSGTDRRASGERVAIDEAAGTVLLTGDVVVTQGDNELRGGRLAIDRKDGTAELTSPPEASFGPGRISARLMRTPGKQPPGKAKTGAAAAVEELNPLTSFKTDPKAPVEVTADSLDVNDQRKVAIFRGDVDATQDTFKILCAQLTAFYKGQAGLVDAVNSNAPSDNGPKTSTELTRIEARKDVRVTSKDGQTATGDWADFDTKTNKVVMGGNVVLSRGKNMVRGTRLLIDMTTGESKIDTAPENTVANPGGGGWTTKTPKEAAAQPEVKGRASAVFFPQDLEKEKETEGAKKKAPAKSPGSAVDGWSATASPGSPGTPAN